MSVFFGDWGIDDVLFVIVGFVEIDVRFWFVLVCCDDVVEFVRVQVLGVMIDEQLYLVKLCGWFLDFIYKEFQLLYFFVIYLVCVFMWEQLFSEVWGYDYFGGICIVDVYVWWFRVKFGDQEQIIGMVCNVGYWFNVNEDENFVEVG